ncbi:hypothetical protein GCM10009741_43720 [Kribbella lupini]|uniref:Aminoglycoside phosphotransferase n=1 Tax=Kribbella lupini TaxID=291602 RepID=A0ABN2BC82_9ACTN
MTFTAGWNSSQRTAAVAWIQEQLDRYGATLTGEISAPRLMPWSATMRVPSSAGTLWFKANGRGTAYEPRLLVALQARAPRWTPTVVAVDDQRAWSLTEDGGEQLKVAAGGAG